MAQRKSKGGRPKIVATPEEFASRADEYFATCDAESPVTITGLMLHLGFESRQSFYDYEKRPEFSYIVKRSRLRVEHAYEIRLVTKDKPTGDIFGLKNLGWSDRHEVEHSGRIDAGVLAVPSDVDSELWAQLAKRSQAVGATNGTGNGNGSHAGDGG